MLFNSLDFAVFLPIVFLLYWFVFQRNLRAQNLLVVAASYLFYGWWDWRFLSLIAFSTVVDYLIGIGLSKEDKSNTLASAGQGQAGEEGMSLGSFAARRKLLLWISIGVNLGFLGFFKYYNFFVDNFIEAFSFFGMQMHASSLNIILPVGISFYTFQTMSYTIDVYRRKLQPTTDFVSFAAFVSFFPQLVAGPIERASNLLPQFYVKRKFTYDQAVDGMRQILWGLFKKVVIADNCATYVNLIFDNSTEYGGSTLLLGAVAFAFQIYGDFSGYSDFAIGTSRLFGFRLSQNFAFPYFSRDMAEFWRRWHISLSTWFRDYVYIPLGGSEVRMGKRIRNVFIIFVVSGFWHGANWTFIVWGALNALFFLPLLLTQKNRQNVATVAENSRLPSLRELVSMLATFLLTVLAWIFFRAENVGHAVAYISEILSGSLFAGLGLPSEGVGLNVSLTELGLLLMVLLLVEWAGRRNLFALQNLELKFGRPLRWAVYAAVIMLVFVFGNFSETEFIYFAF